jgi:hypothetical protein
VSDHSHPPDSAAGSGQVATALELILNQQLELFINLVGQPIIELSTGSGESNGVSCSLHSDRVKAWIAEFAWERLKIVLGEREIERIITILHGKAWHDERTNVPLVEAKEQDPLLDALLTFMHDNAAFDKNCTALKAALGKVARKSGLDTRDRLWPKGAPQLSRRIGELKDLLETAGIDTEIGRRGNGVRYVKLTRKHTTADDTDAPPPGPSIDKSHHPKPLDRNDDSDGNARKNLFAQLAAANGDENERC